MMMVMVMVVYNYNFMFRSAPAHRVFNARRVIAIWFMLLNG